jgi:hypothetical protein
MYRLITGWPTDWGPARCYALMVGEKTADEVSNRYGTGLLDNILELESRHTSRLGNRSNGELVVAQRREYANIPTASVFAVLCEQDSPETAMPRRSPNHRLGGRQ